MVGVLSLVGVLIMVGVLSLVSVLIMVGGGGIITG